MQIELNDLVLYAACPCLQQQKFTLDSPPSSPVTTVLTELMLYAYSRQMEIEKPITWQEMMNRWNRSWWSHREPDDRQAQKDSNNGLIALRQFYEAYREDQRIPVAVNFYYRLHLSNHQVEAMAPVILSDPVKKEKLTVLLLNRTLSSQELTRQLDVFLHCLMLSQAVGQVPAAVEAINITRQHSLRCNAIYPTEQFLQRAQSSIRGILDNMQKNIHYPNWQICPRCSGNDVCLVN